MANWYINPLTGNNANPGTFASPKQTIQAAVNVGAGGDRFKLSDIAPHILAGQIAFNAGFTIDNSKYTVFEPYADGGTFTIQRPDELTPRVGAIIDGNGTGPTIFLAAGLAEKIVLQDVELTNSGGSNALIDGGTEWVYNGIKASNATLGNGSIAMRMGTFCTVNNCFFECNKSGFSYFMTVEGGNGPWVRIQNNYFEIKQVSVNVIGYGFNNGGDIYGNIFDASEITTVNSAIIDVINNNVRVVNNSFRGNPATYSRVLNVASNAGIIYNNIFSNFSHASSRTIFNDGGNRTFQVYGKNAFFNSVAPSAFLAGIDLTSQDVVSAADPFIDAANGDYRLNPATASACIGTGIGNPRSFIDMGAVQSASGGGGGGSNDVFIINE